MGANDMFGSELLECANEPRSIELLEDYPHIIVVIRGIREVVEPPEHRRYLVDEIKVYPTIEVSKHTIGVLEHVPVLNSCDVGMEGKHLCEGICRSHMSSSCRG